MSDKTSDATLSTNLRQSVESPPVQVISSAQGAVEDEILDHRPSHIVGIGASAGGLNALQSLFDLIPPDTGAAFVVVQHLSPNFKTLMDELLSKHTKMPVKLADDGETVLANHVYVMRPKRNIIIADGRLWLTEVDRSQPLNLTINEFFRSLADDVQNRAIGIILSGTGSDGSRGLQELKAVGGLVMVQKPEEAEFDGMPVSAINTGQVDVVGDVDELAPQMVSYVQHPITASKDQAFKEHLAKHNDLLTIIFDRLNEATSIDFAVYKPSTVARRIEHRMGISNKKTLPEYVAVLDERAEEFELLKNDLLIGVTQFFRDPSAFEQIANEIIPQILESKDPDVPVRVWMTGVSSGEEAYSIAMLIVEAMERLERSHQVKIFASDVDSSAMSFASSGVYPSAIRSEVSQARLERFFTLDEQNNFVVSKQLRSMIVFSTHNIIQDPPFSNMDLIVCRNMLIYLKTPAQERALALMHFALRKNGFLFLGSAESLGAQKDYFDVVSSKHKIYRKTKANRIPINPLHANTMARVDPAKRNTKSLAVDLRQQNSALGYGSRTINHAARDRLLDLYAPTGILLGGDKHIIQVFGDCSNYLKKHSQGKITTYFDSLINDDLTVPISTGLAKVSDPEIKVYKMASIPVTSEVGDSLRINLVVNRLDDLMRRAEPHFFISFEEDAVETVKAQARLEEDNAFSEIFSIDSHTRERLRDLDIQLLDSKEELRHAYAELDTTSEELQSTNEELMAANEELQSTNEELQSVNEELYTVNNEYQEKIVELTDLNADLDNLLNSTGYAIVFLDSTLSIRRFTPRTVKYINLLPSDIDRSISDFTLGFNHPELIDDLNHVLSRGESLERLINMGVAGVENSTTLSLTLSPYISVDKSINGVVMTIREID